jgi:hypothetical protein
MAPRNRREEKFAVGALQRHLEASGRRVSVQPGANPPDYDVCVDGVRWSVEVTLLMRDRIHCGRRISERGDSALFREWVKGMETEALRRGSLDCSYRLRIQGSLSAFNMVHDEIGPVLQESLARLTGSRRNERKIHIQRELWHLSVEPTSKARPGKEPRPRLLRSHVEGGCEDDRPDALVPGILREALERKRTKLEGVPRPIVLLLVNDYYGACSNDYSQVYPAEMDDFFDHVCVVDPWNGEARSCHRIGGSARP